MGLKEAALRLGIIGLVQFVPLFVLTLVTGWTADRVDRRWIARGSVALELGCAVALALVHLHRHDDAWRALCHCGAARRRPRLCRTGAWRAGAQSRPAQNAAPRHRDVVDRLAEPERSSARRSAAISTPSRLRALCGKRRAVRRSLVGLIAIRPMRSDRTYARAANPWAQMVEGLRYVRHNRLVLGAISLDLFAVLLGGATAMLPVFARDVLHAGPAGAWAFARGARGRRNPDRRLLRRPPAQGQCRGEDAGRGRRVRRRDDRLRPVASMPLSLVCLAMLGAADMFSVYVRQSLIQLYTPDEMRGRVGRGVVAVHLRLRTNWARPKSGFLAAR